MEFLDIPIQVEAHIQNDRLQPQRISWRQQTYSVIGLGRQWAEADGKHILVETHDGSRMEILYTLDFNWRLQRYWPALSQA